MSIASQGPVCERLVRDPPPVFDLPPTISLSPLHDRIRANCGPDIDRFRSFEAKSAHREIKAVSIRELDDFDLRIASVLSQEGRISWRDLADRIGLSFSPTLRRVRRLEEEGTITGYAALFDESHLIGSMTVFITVTMERQVKEVLEPFERKVSGMTEVVGGFLTTGGSDYLLHALVRDLDHYRALLDTLTTMPGVARIRSNFAVKSFSRRAAPLFPAARTR
jgi:DNA-binding Lrp family transcriptional regulator